MNKSALFLLLATFLSYGMEEEEGIYLAAGSVRSSNVKTAFPVNHLWQEEKADLSLRNAYPGKETTSMDLKESKIYGVKHIVGDASTYQFGKNTIQAAYLERLPTIGLCQANQGMKSIAMEENYLGKCIQNIGSAMKQGAEIEIEWCPYIGFCMSKPEDIKSVFNKDLTKKSPFTTSIDVNVALSGVKMAYMPSLTFDDNVPQHFIACAQALSEKIKKLICFYEKEGVGSKALLEKRLDQEIWLFKQLEDSNYKVILSKGPQSGLAEFSEAIKRIAFIPMEDSSQVGAYVSFEKNGERFMGILNDQSSFLANTLLNFILCDASIEYNSLYVKKFMKKNGFEAVTIERGTSLRNGRENVVIVKGVKA